MATSIFLDRQVGVGAMRLSDAEAAVRGLPKDERQVSGALPPGSGPNPKVGSGRGALGGQTGCATAPLSYLTLDR